MPDGDTSPAVILWISLAIVAMVYAFVCEIRQDRLARPLRRWVQQAYPNAWRALPWLFRRTLAARIALRVLIRQQLVTDPALLARYRPIAQLETEKLVAIVVGLACCALVLVGTRVWGWTW
jgi:hypothetical protein